MSARPLRASQDPARGLPVAELVWLLLVALAVLGMVALSYRLSHTDLPAASRAEAPAPAEPVRLARGEVVATAERRVPVWRVAAQE